MTEWTLSDELSFIRSIGWHRRAPLIGQRLGLLKGYLAGLRLRRRSVGLDLEACRVAAVSEIAAEERLARIDAPMRAAMDNVRQKRTGASA